jgi:two-component system LytT family sensor kinase
LVTSRSFFDWKFQLPLWVTTVVWMCFHAWILSKWFSIEMSAWDSAVSNIILLNAALLLATVILNYAPRSGRLQFTIGLSVILAIGCQYISREALIRLPQAIPEYLTFLDETFAVRCGISFLVIASAGVGAIFYTQFKDQQETAAREAATQAIAREAELQKLQLQLQPHFLFNCLNSVNAMILVRPNEAQTMVQQLSDFLRTTIRRADEQWISFSEELNYLELYLSIEKIRFGHRLEVNIERDELSLNWKIPTLLLQPLVENAIKFGLYGTTGKVVISIDAFVNNDLLALKVSNPFDPDMQPSKGSGFGLSGLKRRLYLLFAQNDLIETKADNNIFVVVLKIPPRA